MWLVLEELGDLAEVPLVLAALAAPASSSLSTNHG